MPIEPADTTRVLESTDLITHHDGAIAAWYAHSPDAVEPGDDPASIARAQHFCNFQLWRLEDEARRRDVGDSVIAETKRAIDRWNQRRNDLVERLDRSILAAVASVDSSNAALHSETAGMMTDRLSILALKIWHMGKYASEASNPDLAQECLGKQARLREQRADLASCLDALMTDVAAGKRYFKLYRQFKAYNDPRLNPVVRTRGA